jgi:hypothetical protein
MRTFTCTGEFWLPGNEKNTFKGTLSFDPGEGARLKLFGNPQFLRTLNQPIKKLQFPLLHGIVNIDGEWQRVTAWNPEVRQVTTISKTNRSITTHDIASQVILHATIILLGIHYHIEQTKTLTIYLAHSLHWLETCAQELFAQPTRNDSWSLEWKVVPSKGAKILLGFEKVRLLCWDRLEPVSTHEHLLFVRILFEEGQDLKSCIFYLNHLLKFFVFLFSKKVTPLFVHGLNTVEEKFELLYPHPAFQIKQTWNITYDSKLLQRLLEAKLESSLQHWFEKANELDLITELYASSIYNEGFHSSSDLKVSFLNLFTALESYHKILCNRGMFEKTDKQKEEYFQEILNLVNQSSSVSPEAKNFLQNCKGNLTSKSQRAQFEDIFKHHQQILEKLEFMHDETQRKEFFETLKKFRNQIAHEGKIPPDTEKLQIAFYRLRLFLELCLLGELGFTPKECKEIISQAWYYQFRKLPSSP